MASLRVVSCPLFLGVCAIREGGAVICVGRDVFGFALSLGHGCTTRCPLCFGNSCFSCGTVHSSLKAFLQTYSAHPCAGSSEVCAGSGVAESERGLYWVRQLHPSFQLVVLKYVSTRICRPFSSRC